ncbi:hypothetical protein PMAYCL1PPCAC_31101, partial [Pristionchus mayeri]
KKHEPAMRLLLLLLTALPATVLSCADGFNTWLDGRCFRMNYYSPTYYDNSFSTCDKDNARLPTIKNAEENDEFFSALKQYNSFSAYSFWLGLTCNGEKFVWADGSEAEYTNFADDYNCTSSSTGRRYYIDNDRLWYESKDGRDYGINNIVCEGINRSASPCDSFALLQTGKSTEVCYQLQGQEQTWNQAENTCKDLGAHLSAIHDQTLNDFIRRTAVAAGKLDGVHIGITEDSNTGNYSWSDGSEIDYDNFVPGFPSDSYGNCVAMETGFLPGQWMNVDCYSTKLPYVCTKPAFYATNSQPAGCPVKTQYAPGDEIFSPAYPQAPGATSCDYLLLEPNQNKRAEVTIDFFESNTCCDTLTVYDGLFGSNILQTLTGFYSSPLTIRASSNAIRLSWNAKSGEHVRGFHAKMSSCC